MSKLPFMQFYPADWLQDTQILSLEAQGAWIKILCALHAASERGRKKSATQEWKQFLGYPEDDRGLFLLARLSEVADIEARDKDGNACSILESAEITISSRRMIRDETKRIQELERKRQYEKRNPTRRRRKPDINPTPIYQRSEFRDHIEDKDKSPASEIPDEQTPKGVPKKPKEPPSPEGVAAAKFLSDLIGLNLPSRTQPTEGQLTEWAHEADRINRIDNHPWTEIKLLIAWCQQDTFWKVNILSMDKFRKQWNQLAAKRTAEGSHGERASGANRVTAPDGKYSGIA